MELDAAGISGVLAEHLAEEGIVGVAACKQALSDTALNNVDLRRGSATSIGWVRRVVLDYSPELGVRLIDVHTAPLSTFSSLIDDTVMERVAKKPVSRLPSFRYVSPKLHHGKVLLLGDCVHTVKPYFGLGANSALEDVATLGSIMENDENGYEEVAKEFTKRR